MNILENKIRKYFQKNINYLKNHYDYLFIDTNPSLNITNINGYLIAINIILIADNAITIDVITNIATNLEVTNNTNIWKDKFYNLILIFNEMNFKNMNIKN